ncbi:MAG: DUF503 domain-containing protein [Chloroflexi bacterium]|nr:DUF503 domain-containing protein [Chloroflexota bacterium]
MGVGVCRLKLHIPGSRSLKDKRSVVKSLISRLQKQFNLSVAEVDDHELWQMATIAMACVSNHNDRVDEVLNAAISLIGREFPTIEVIEKEIETY